MKLKKIKIFSGIFLLITVIFLTMWLVFRVGVRHYVQLRIQHDLEEEIEKLISEKYEEYKDVYFDGGVYYTTTFSGNTLVPVNLIIIDSQCKYFEIMDSKDTSIIKYYKNNQDMANEKKYRHINVDGKSYYIMVRNKTIDNNKITFIAMATPTELYKFISRINFIFIMIMIVSGTVLLLMSYRAGVKLERSKERLNDYFQNASHELKTPIMSIQGYAEGISSNVIRDYSKAAEIIMCESDKMNLLVQEILLLSKMDSGYADMSRQEIDLKDIIYDSLNMSEAEAKRNNISLTVDIDNDRECMIFGNESQLERAFMNVLMNAFRYAEHNVTVTIRRKKRWIITEIADDGRGISETDMPYIFDRFYKGENGGQHGIGLAIVKEIIHLHKGKIKAVNNNGAAFSIWLKAIN